jgi:hypothetical protein
MYRARCGCFLAHAAQTFQRSPTEKWISLDIQFEKPENTGEFEPDYAREMAPGNLISDQQEANQITNSEKRQQHKKICCQTLVNRCS